MPDFVPVIKPKSEYAPVGLKSSLVHNAGMDFDPAQRRDALRNFIHRSDLTISRWEKDAEVGDGTLRKFLSGATNTLTDKTYQSLAHAASAKLGRSVAVSELQGVTPSAAQEITPRSEVRRLDPQPPAPQSSEMPRDVAVYGTVSGGAGGLQMGNDHALDWVRRPPRFKDRKGKPKDIFACLVEEMSMVPRYGPGDLVYVDPLRQPQIGDYVVVEIQDAPHGERKAILKRLAARTASKITLEQFNPERTFEVKTAHIVHLYRVMTTNDLLGV